MGLLTETGNELVVSVPSTSGGGSIPLSRTSWFTSKWIFSVNDLLTLPAVMDATYLDA